MKHYPLFQFHDHWEPSSRKVPKPKAKYRKAVKRYPTLATSVRSIPPKSVESADRYLWDGMRFATLREAECAVVEWLGLNYPIKRGVQNGWNYSQIGSEVIVWQ